MHQQQHQRLQIPTPQEAKKKCRYFKKVWEKQQEHLRVGAIKFGVFSARDIDQFSTTQITSSSIYNPETLQPNEFGPLDLRLGSSKGRDDFCASCKLPPIRCVGHFGHIDLVLPCFHIGYIKDVIQILRMICKSCSRILLSPTAMDTEEQSGHFWRKRMRYFL